MIPMPYSWSKWINEFITDRIKSEANDFNKIYERYIK